MDKPKGGRGRKANYESTHVRIPSDIKDRVEELKNLYFSGNLEYHDELIARDAQMAREYEKVLTGSLDKPMSAQNPLPPLKYTREVVKQILKQRKSAKESIAKLLTALYGVEITKEDLT